MKWSINFSSFAVSNLADRFGLSHGSRVPLVFKATFVLSDLVQKLDACAITGLETCCFLHRRNLDHSLLKACPFQVPLWTVTSWRLTCISSPMVWWFGLWFCCGFSFFFLVLVHILLNCLGIPGVRRTAGRAELTNGTRLWMFFGVSGLKTLTHLGTLLFILRKIIVKANQTLSIYYSHTSVQNALFSFQVVFGKQ